ncbi:MAG: DUF956 family protein [Furfurilactobacillus sp.]|jgi:hypothetical protein|uniref:DUF956 family protein n=1 Tax=Furfurilactobacillus milii TaxID=2888272 RepID=A0ABT6DC06_9LACO|nr:MULTISPECIES: DUF956 family protein [Furfurilactobacillus]QLE66014.1 regulator of the mannose operon ManO [Furfurilactobacillus rossiae]MCF6161754.1 DUF956 family protein [Furfurilactobacillus milii]MCF6164131.1 DUF956 family protein [Furfurilactobacillus milii]MCF6419630.1 DUF956 family protein [Furfurilactobacillus milii]MCH4012533.1 DUF956 family protein [Furfurilactobacillus sp.]
MVESLNTKVEMVIDGTSYMGMGDYGKIMVGDKAFEFYNDRDSNKFIQIPWEDVDLVIASVMFKGKVIPRYALQTTRNGTYKFSSRHSKAVLRAIRNHVDADHIVRSLTFFQVMRRNLKALFTRRPHSRKQKQQ